MLTMSSKREEKKGGGKYLKLYPLSPSASADSDDLAGEFYPYCLR